MNLVLTFDYELFGDGSGDVFQHMIHPTDEILKICATHNIKTTIFFEVVEYIKLKEEWEKGNKMGYKKNPIEAIENQVQEAALKGHDIQLHIHPQWVDAVFENGQWEVDFDNWRLGDFSIERNYTIEDLIRDSKNALEALVREVIPDYECIALRAGGYNIMPSAEVYQAMVKLGLKIDSSVYPGGYETGSLSRYDYSQVSLKKDYWWADSDDITKESMSEQRVMEIPIFALPQRRIHKILNFDKIKSLLSKRDKAMSSLAREKIEEKSFVEKMQFLFEKEAFTWDFCMFNKSMHRRFLKYIEKNLLKERNTFVLIGHPKSWRDDKSLISLLNFLQSSDYDYNFMTLREVYYGFCE